jgi:hypothetical protein
MWKKLLLGLAVCGFMLQLGHAQEANPALTGVAKTMGAIDLTLLQYTGSGSIFALGQNPSPGMPWVRYNAKSYTRTINYDTGSLQDDVVRTPGDASHRGAVFITGEQRLISGVVAPMPGTRLEKLLPRDPTMSLTARTNSGLPRTA